MAGRYPSPDSLYETLNSSRRAGFAYKKVLEQTPREDVADECAHHIFSSVFLRRDVKPEFTTLKNGRPCIAMVSVKRYPLAVREKTIRRMAESGWGGDKWYGSMELVREKGSSEEEYVLVMLDAGLVQKIVSDKEEFLNRSKIIQQK